MNVSKGRVGAAARGRVFGALRFLGGGASVLAVWLFVASCGGGGGGSPPCESPADFAGTWRGAITHNFAGPGSLTVTIAQTACDVAGRWVATFDSGGGQDLPVTGTVSGQIAHLVLGDPFVEDDPSFCRFDADGTLVGANHMSGPYASDEHCSQNESGIFDVTR